MILTPAEICRNHAVRSCILAEVIARNPIEIAYRNLCTKLGESAIGYLEFDYWYYRFYEGNHSLECDFNMKHNPKYRLLTTLPTDIILEISQYLDSEERLALRQVSLGMKHICNAVPVELALSSLLVYEDRLEFYYGENLILLKKPHFKKFEMLIKCEFDSNALEIVFGTETSSSFDYQVPGTADEFFGSHSMPLTRHQSARNLEIRTFILDEVLSKKPVKEAYKNLCVNFREKTITYYELDFWFYRFYGGDKDLQCDRDFERDLGSKHRGLTNLPPELIQQIATSLHPRERFPLREVCQTMKMVFNGIPIKIDNAELKCSAQKLVFNYGPNFMKCVKVDGGCNIIKDGRLKFIKNGNFLKVAANHVKFVMDHSRLSIGTLLIHQLCLEGQEVWDSYWTVMKKLLKSLTHQLQIDHLRFNSGDLKGLMDFVPFVKPGATIDLVCNGKPDGMWNTLQELVGGGAIFKVSSVKIRLDSFITTEEVVEIRENIMELPAVNEFIVTFQDAMSGKMIEEIDDGLKYLPNFGKCRHQIKPFEIIFNQGPRRDNLPLTFRFEHFLNF
ncbi:hypothetical protein CRE_15692 [Caenorhabditis remanei]|uniref:F-box domain-containing protein n=1 Tax=Caenorhabditis remanei TaxID=31234 RepID=E3N878_CAERE|nr:hypothetical protein CRE_15692 [Caenorhabditis remanei]